MLLPCCYWKCSIESTIGGMGMMILDGSDKTINESDEVWRQVQRKYVMIQMIQKLGLLNEK